MLNFKAVSQFKKDFKKYRYDEETLNDFEEVVTFLRKGKKLPQKNLNHPLSGNYRGMRECHIRPDTLLIYW